MSSSEDTSQIFHSVETAVTGFVGTVKAFQNGTPEVKALIADESALIFECK